MAAGHNGFGPVCQHGDVPANEKEKQRRETHGRLMNGRVGAFTAHAGDYGSGLFPLTVFSSPNRPPSRLIGSASERARKIFTPLPPEK